MKKTAYSTWSKYLLIFSVAWFLVVIVSYFYVEDVQEGLHSLLKSMLESV